MGSWAFEEHIHDVNTVLEAAAKDGFEFKLTQGHFNQAVIVLWGCVCEKNGRRPQEKQIKQLAEWPRPQTEHDVISCLACVNYLRSWMNPDWLDSERVLRPFRKKGVRFKELWTGPNGQTFKDAFLAIRTMLARDVILHHPDFEAAARPL